MKITFEPDTKETRIADLKRRKANDLISETLCKRCHSLLLKGKSIIYYIGENGKVVKIKIKR